MSFAAVITWFITICFGLLLLGIWLVEYDRDGRRSGASRSGRRGGASRLPVPVISGHALLAVAGIPIWLVYIVTDEARLAWLATFMLVGVALLGLAMIIRWIGVYRAHRVVAEPAAVTAANAFEISPAPARASPPERNFPVAVVVCHGVFAVTTVVLVLLTTLGVFVS
jgi:hypothetical protein